MVVEVLSLHIAEALKTSFNGFRESLGENEIIGYGILSHDTADSCCPVVSTRAGIENFTLGSSEDFLFSPVEWDKFDRGPSFDLVNREICRIYDEGDYSIDPNWHIEFREFVFEANVKALETLVDQGFFGTDQQRDSIFIVFTLSDSEVFNTHEPEWVIRLNTSKVVSRNFKWRKKYA